MQNQILGEYPCKVDAKGRVRLPSALLKQLEDFGAYKFVVNRGYKKYLVLYPEKVWGLKTNELTADWAPKRITITEKTEPFFQKQFTAVSKFGTGYF